MLFQSHFKEKKRKDIDEHCSQIKTLVNLRFCKGALNRKQGCCGTKALTDNIYVCQITLVNHPLVQFSVMLHLCFSSFKKTGCIAFNHRETLHKFSTKRLASSCNKCLQF